AVKGTPRTKVVPHGELPRAWTSEGKNGHAGERHAEGLSEEGMQLEKAGGLGEEEALFWGGGGGVDELFSRKRKTLQRGQTRRARAEKMSLSEANSRQLIGSATVTRAKPRPGRAPGARNKEYTG
ncbi:hypothetical protein GOP47_0027082, partial [Adiantum capillus-veneris]